LSALDTTKEILRITSSAGLSKDVIDLLPAKVSLLAEQIVLLEKENTLLRTKASHFESENIQLRQQLQNSQPVGFVENMGVLWKRTATGFEPIPYCKECPRPTIMVHPHRGSVWVCGTGDHVAPLSAKPPG
jgi:hypothetical protein